MVQTISPKELAERQSYEKGGIDLIDVRTPMEYGEVHVSYACNVPLDRLNAHEIVGKRQANPERPLYVICKSGTRGKQACEMLNSAGLTNVFNVEGGTSACEQAGLPVVRGKKVIGLDRQMRMIAGSLVLLGVGLSFVNPYFIGLSAFVGAGLVFAGATDICPMLMMLARMPWNQSKDNACSTSTAR